MIRFNIIIPFELLAIFVFVCLMYFGMTLGEFIVLLVTIILYSLANRRVKEK